MSARVTIETASRADAELIIACLQLDLRAESARGFSVIRLGRKTDAETATVMETVARSVEQHQLAWARVRYDDDERVFRTNGGRPPRVQPTPEPLLTSDVRARVRTMVDAIADRTLNRDITPGPGPWPGSKT
jgi:hypothetical protein